MVSRNAGIGGVWLSLIILSWCFRWCRGRGGRSNVDVSDRVRPGHPLAMLEVPEMRADLRHADTGLGHANA